MLNVELVCVGDVEAEVLDFISAGLGRELGAQVKRTGSVPIPPDAYDAERDQYSSGLILALLAGKLGGVGPVRRLDEPRPAAATLLAITTVDLYVPELNFVLGEARPADRACIVSLARLVRTRGGGPVGRHILKERALKEAIHETGHLLGLGHCGARDCVMFFSNSIRDTDRKSAHFCSACRRGVRA